MKIASLANFLNVTRSDVVYGLNSAYSLLSVATLCIETIILFLANTETEEEGRFFAIEVDRGG